VCRLLNIKMMRQGDNHGNLKTLHRLTDHDLVPFRVNRQVKSHHPPDKCSMSSRGIYNSIAGNASFRSDDTADSALIFFNGKNLCMGIDLNPQPLGSPGIGKCHMEGVGMAVGRAKGSPEQPLNI